MNYCQWKKKKKNDQHLGSISCVRSGQYRHLSYFNVGNILDVWLPIYGHWFNRVVDEADGVRVHPQAESPAFNNFSGKRRHHFMYMFELDSFVFLLRGSIDGVTQDF